MEEAKQKRGRRRKIHEERFIVNLAINTMILEKIDSYAYDLGSNRTELVNFILSEFDQSMLEKFKQKLNSMKDR